MQIKIVTAIYNLKWDHLGGRPNRLPRYVRSLKVISKYCPDIPIYCFTNKETMNKMNVHFPEIFNTHNVEFIIKELEDTKFHDQIQAKKSPEKMVNYDEVMVKNRCFELVLSKLRWMQEVVARTNASYVYWIDAGLLHQDVFDISLANNKTDLGNYSDLDIINSDRLKRMAKDNRGIFFLQQNPHNKLYRFVDDKIRYFNDPGMIGGIFGIPASEVSRLKNAFDVETQRLLDRDIILTEESIISKMIEDHDYVTTKTFTVMGTRPPRPKDVFLYDVIKEL